MANAVVYRDRRISADSGCAIGSLVVSAVLVPAYWLVVSMESGLA